MAGQEKQIEQEARRKIEEYNILTRSLHEYWAGLVAEAVRIARQRGLETCVADVNSGVDSNGDITVRRNGQEVDVSELIELAGESCPEVYRKYHEGLERHAALRSELKDIRDSIA